MQAPPQIAFHAVSHTEWLDDYLRKRIERLEHIADDIVWCRVAVEQTQGSHRTGNIYRTSVELLLPPNHKLAAAKDAPVEDPQVQLRPLVRRTFEAIERQLKRALERRRNDVKHHADRGR